MPQGSDPNRNLELVLTSLLEFNQRLVRLGFDPAMEGAIVRGQAGTPIAANLLGQALPRAAMLFPKSLNASTTDTKPLANLPSAFAARSRCDNSLPQILAQRTHK